MNSVLRTLLTAALASGLILVVFWRLSAHQDQRAIAELRALNEEMRERLDAHRAMLERLGRSRRLAHVRILDQTRTPSGGVDQTTVLFVELDDDGGELARQTFTVPGDVLFIDTWTVKFAASDVALGNPLRGRTLVLLRRIYSDQMPPSAGFLIDTPGAAPPGYAGTDLSRFEQRLWSQFWDVATDESLATELGVRVAQGEAVYKPVSAGATFDFVVDAAGGISLTPTGQERADAAHSASGS